MEMKNPNGLKSDPYVLQTELEYLFLKKLLHDEVERFEELRKAHDEMVNMISKDLTDKYMELQDAITEAKKHIRERRS